ncbi:MAG: hypothetical protein H7834_14525, partial [Magnetococcus sp. YQC-9]
MKTVLRMLGIGVIALLLTACGGGGSGAGSKSGSTTSTVTTTTTTTTYYGIFQGSTVVGVHYKAVLGNQVKEGETDSQGRFEYISNGTTISPVIFSVGGVTLGTLTPKVTTGSYSMNVFDLVNAADVDAQAKAINLQRFLSSISSSSNSEVISVSSATRTALAAESVKLNELAANDFSTKATALINTLVMSNALPAGTSLVAESTVTAHMQDSKTQIDAARVGTLELTTGADSVQADGKTRVLVQVKATTSDNNPLVGGLVHVETTLGSFGSEADLCSSSTTPTRKMDLMTDANGKAFLLLTPGCASAGTATITATLGGRIVTSQVKFTTTTVQDNTTRHTGVFQGYSLVGVHYKSQLNGVILEGETNSEGKFQYLSEGTIVAPVTFSIGGVVLGTIIPPLASGYYYVTVHDLVNA